jgi:hypothetical protein
MTFRSRMRLPCSARPYVKVVFREYLMDASAITKGEQGLSLGLPIIQTKILALR